MYTQGTPFVYFPSQSEQTFDSKSLKANFLNNLAVQSSLTCL